MQKATIVKIGNSMGVRIKHEVLNDLSLKPGDEVEVIVRPAAAGFNKKHFVEALKLARQIGGGIPSIPDPVAWQKEIRKDKPLTGRS